MELTQALPTPGPYLDASHTRGKARGCRNDKQKGHTLHSKLSESGSRITSSFTDFVAIAQNSCSSKHTLSLPTRVHLLNTFSPS